MGRFLNCDTVLVKPNDLISCASPGQNSEAAYPASSRLLMETHLWWSPVHWWGAHSLSGVEKATILTGFSALCWSSMVRLHRTFIPRTGPGKYNNSSSVINNAITIEHFWLSLTWAALGLNIGEVAQSLWSCLMTENFDRSTNVRSSTKTVLFGSNSSRYARQEFLLWDVGTKCAIKI